MFNVGIHIVYRIGYFISFYFTLLWKNIYLKFNEATAHNLDYNIFNLFTKSGSGYVMWV